MVQFLEGFGLAEDDARVAVQGVAPERLDDDGARRNAILTEERYAGPAAEDLFGLVVNEGERLEGLRIQGDGPARDERAASQSRRSRAAR